MSSDENESSGGGPGGNGSNSNGSRGGGNGSGSESGSRSGGGNGGGSGGNGGSGNGGNGGSGGDGPSTAEKAITVVSVLFTLLLFALLVSQALSVPAEATPEAHVESVEELPGNRTAVTVVMRNPSNEGLLTATVAVGCTQPPPTIDFTHVPTDGRQKAVLVCPGAVGSDVTANVTVWQSA